MKYDVFISYSRKDLVVADKICDVLDKAGVSYFIDRQGIGGGMEFPKVIATAIKESELFLFLASENSYSSKFTTSEITFAFNKKQKNQLLPYVIDSSSLPDELEFVFSCINIRNIKEHPIETTLVEDILDLLGRNKVHDPLCPCGSGKLFKDCHGKHAVVPESYASKPTGPVSDLTKASPAAYDDIISKISNILKTFKINVLSITADIRSTGVMYRIVPGSGIRPAAIANLHREIAFALGVCEAIVIEYSDGTVALTLKDYDSPVERTWKVGDYYDVGGKKGVVFWVDETGKHGKIVSLDQAEKQWCTDAEYEKDLKDIASDEYDGMKNLQSIKKISDWRNKYPAFAWCADHGDGWYLPAIKELELLLLNDEVHDAVNNQIAREGKTRLFSEGEYKVYWSSTEIFEWCAWYVRMYDGSTNYLNRNDSRYVRAVSAF